MRKQNFQENNKLIYLIATPIGNLDEFTPRAINIIANSDLVACEDTRVTGNLLKHFNISKPLISLREHNEVSQSKLLVNEIRNNNKKVCYVSDAGYPCLSDPGNKLVQLMNDNDICVSVISGPSAFLNALVGSGLPTTHFYFHGFLNPKEKARKDELESLKTREETLIFYEAPHRISKTLNDMAKILGNRDACIARELTKKHEEYIHGTLQELASLDPETIKGEIVIIIKGLDKEKEVQIDDDSIYKIVIENMNNNMSAKDAIKETSESLKISKNEVYKIYHSRTK